MSPNAPELMLDLLMAHGEPLPAQALCRAGALMGIPEGTVRVGLTRLAADRKIRRTERGSYALERAGPALSRTVDDWQQREAQRMPWRCDWLGVHDAGVPRADKTAWRRHTLALALRGFAPLLSGLQTRPDNLRGGLAAEREALYALGLAPQAVVFRLADLDASTSARARQLWNVDCMAAECSRMRAALHASQAQWPHQPLDVTVRDSLLLGRAVIAHLLRDPLLPDELMPAAPRQQLHAAMQGYQQQARARWRQWMALS